MVFSIDNERCWCWERFSKWTNWIRYSILFRSLFRQHHENIYLCVSIHTFIPKSKNTHTHTYVRENSSNEINNVRLRLVKSIAGFCTWDANHYLTAYIIIIIININNNKSKLAQLWFRENICRWIGTFQIGFIRSIPPDSCRMNVEGVRNNKRNDKYNHQEW